jgi:hypothetical protein
VRGKKRIGEAGERQKEEGAVAPDKIKRAVIFKALLYIAC